MSEVISEPGSPSEAAAVAEEALAAGAAPGDAAVAEPGQQPAVAEPQFDSREIQAELDYLREQNAQLVQWAQQQGASQQQAQQYATEQTGFDPASLVDVYGNVDVAALVSLIVRENEKTRNGIAERIAQIEQPLMARQEQETIAEGEQRLQDILGDDISRNGEFSPDPAADKEARALVRTIADQMFPEVAQRYGMTPQAAEIAMTRAAGRVRTLLGSHGKTAIQSHVNHAATLAGVHGEPAGGASGVITSSSEILQPGELARRYAADASRARNV